ncbi:TPA: hypothetical protein L5691_002643 [Pseudomonas aeruginosa]|nr:hypothetical protein [Pseudomonas aeruginosa]
MVSCSKNGQEQLSTWVSFRSAQGPLLGQFSVSANTHRDRCNYNPEPAQPGWKHRSRISETLGHVHRNPHRKQQDQ